MKRLPHCALKAVQVRYDHVNGRCCWAWRWRVSDTTKEPQLLWEVALSLAPDHPRALRYLIRLRVESQPLTMSSL